MKNTSMPSTRGFRRRWARASACSSCTHTSDSALGRVGNPACAGEAPAVGSVPAASPRPAPVPNFTAATAAARVLGRIDMRHLHAHHAAIHQPVMSAAALLLGRPIGVMPAASAGHGHQLDVGRADAAVLTVDQHPVEAGVAQHFHHLWGRKHHRAAERRRAVRDLFLHTVGFHRMSPRKISSRRRSAGAGDEYRGF